jgi:hypothetical protein
VTKNQQGIILNKILPLIRTCRYPWASRVKRTNSERRQSASRPAEAALGLVAMPIAESEMAEQDSFLTYRFTCNPYQSPYRIQIVFSDSDNLLQVLCIYVVSRTVMNFPYKKKEWKPQIIKKREKKEEKIPPA